MAVGSTTSGKASGNLPLAALPTPLSTADLQPSGAGTGTVVYSNKDKYEGEWLNGKRHGVGALWMHDTDRYRIRYTGEWQKDRFDVRPMLFTHHHWSDSLVILASR